MRYLSAAVLLLPLVAALPSSPLLEARGGKRCSTSAQCGEASLYCKHGSCSPRRGLNSPCYKNNGCLSSLCVNKRCAKADAAPLALGAKCSSSASCASGYCGKARCAVPQPAGAACYKNVGCLSGVCSAGKCAGASTTPTTPPTREPVVVPGNVARNPSFEDGTLQPFATTGAVKLVKGGAYDGEYSAELAASAAAPASIGQDVGGGKKRATISAFYASISYLASDVVVPLSDNACAITAWINGHTSGYDAAPLFVKPGQTDWLQHTFYVPSNQEITSLAIGTQCYNKATATIKIDAVSFVPFYGPANGGNLDMGGDLLRNGDFKDGLQSWTVSGDVTTSVAGPVWYTTNQGDDLKYALFTAATPASATSASSASISQIFNTFADPTATNGYQMGGSFEHYVDSFASTVTGAACELVYSLNGIVQSTVPLTQADGPDRDGEYYFQHHNVESMIPYTTPGLAWPAELKLSCDPGASATVRVDGLFVVADNK